MMYSVSLAVLGTAAGHGAMTLPVTRMSTTQAVGGTCMGENSSAPAQNATCFWFNDGCTIGCNACSKDCGHLKAAFGLCCAEQMKPTLNDPKLRTFKDIGGVLDVAMRYNPWRAPGFAPVFDPCGLAGGMLPGTAGKLNPPPPGIDQGSSGQELPEVPGHKSTWIAGSIQEVSWGINANHGGGYAYRLCPKVPGQNLTEACFQQHHLQFVGNTSWIQFADDVSNRTAIPATRVTEGTSPAGASWTRNPIPACGDVTGGGIHNPHSCKTSQFEPPLQEYIPAHPQYAPQPGLYGFGQGHCVGLHAVGPPTDVCTEDEENFWTSRFHFNIIDKIQLPADLPAGEYAVSFRWDSEQTPQVWANCADVTIRAAETVV